VYCHVQVCVLKREANTLVINHGPQQALSTELMESDGHTRLVNEGAMTQDTKFIRYKNDGARWGQQLAFRFLLTLLRAISILILSHSL
jgi:hypothetical protein